MALGFNQTPDKRPQARAFQSPVSLKGPVDITVQKPVTGQPLSESQITIAPRQTNRNSQRNTQTLSTPDLPPPHLVAPWVYHPPRAANYFQNNQTNYFNAPTDQADPGTVKPEAPPPVVMPAPAPVPMTAPPPPMMASPPPQALPPSPPPAPPEGNKPPENNTPDAQKPSEVKEGGLDEQTIELFNNRLDNRNETVRADSAMDFFKLIEGNPELSEASDSKDTVNAFVGKILKDPSPVVRQGGLLALEMGYIHQPDAEVFVELKRLSEQNGLFGIESDQVNTILDALRAKGLEPSEQKPPAGQQLNLVSEQEDLVPVAAGHGPGAPPPQLDVTSMSSSMGPNAGGGHG